MNFNSIDFLFGFLPLAWLTYQLAAKRIRLAILLAASAIFYFKAGVMDFAILSVCLVWGYTVGLVLSRYKSRRLLIVGLLFPFTLLAAAKYNIFFKIWLNIDINFMDIELVPAGMSFYCFQIGSYLVDTYSGRILAERNPIKYGAFVMFFPHFISGPILRYENIKFQFEKLSSNGGDINYFSALKYITMGYLYKVFFADVTALCIPDTTEISNILDVVSYVVARSFHIYFDFWGYSLIALGIAKLFGIDIPRNFEEPYKSRNIKEFWRRWHVTLSTWLRDYVYVPLGGNRNYICNILIVFLLCGAWHGAGFRFVVWGAYHAFLVIFYHFNRIWWDRMPKAVGIALTFLLVSMGWPLFFIGVEGYTQMIARSMHIGAPTVPWFAWAWLFLVGSWVFLVEEQKVLFVENRETGYLGAVGVGVLLAITVMFFSLSQTFVYFRF